MSSENAANKLGEKCKDFIKRWLTPYGLLVTTAVLVGFVATVLTLVTLFVVSSQKEFCDLDIDLSEAAVLMEPEIGIADATVYGPVSTGYNDLCNRYANKTETETEFGFPISNNDTLFRNNDWTPYAYTVVQIVGWDIIDPGDGRSKDVQDLLKLVQVTFFNNPTWWREQALYESLHYDICGFSSPSIRYILTENDLMLTQEFVEHGGPEDDFLYKYDITASYGRLRVTLRDVTDSKQMWSRGRCAVWSQLESPERTTNMDTLIVTFICVTLILVCIAMFYSGRCCTCVDEVQVEEKLPAADETL